MTGVLLVNKPTGITSHKAINLIKKQFNVDKIGHCGTLDPFAQGLLIVLLGRATRISRFLLNEDKSYSGIIELGTDTDTFDIDGKITNERCVTGISSKSIIEMSKEFIGKIMQSPPIHSAIKIKGKKAYELARAGKEVELEERLVEIKSFDIDKIVRNDIRLEKIEIYFKAKVSKGTYIRSIASDLGSKLGCGAYLKKLIRTDSSGFNVDDSFDLVKVLKWDSAKLKNSLISITDALNFNKLVVNEIIAEKVKNGVSLIQSDLGKHKENLINSTEVQHVIVTDINNTALAIYRFKDSKLKADIVF